MPVDCTQAVCPRRVQTSEELTLGTHFRVAPNNKHGVAERKRPFAFLAPQNRFRVLGKKSQRRGAIFLARSQRLLPRSDCRRHPDARARPKEANVPLLSAWLGRSAARRWGSRRLSRGGISERRAPVKPIAPRSVPEAHVRCMSPMGKSAVWLVAHNYHKLGAVPGFRTWPFV
jgi:hypothetical protein